MAKSTYPKDRFDDLPREGHRVGAHRAENPRRGGWAITLWAVLATVVLIAIGILATLLLSGRLGAATTPTATPVVDTSYEVLVLNASGDDAVLESVTQAVSAAGWTQDKVISGDAQSNDFPKTTVYYARPGDEGAARGLAQAIGGADVIRSDAYASGNSVVAQLTIVIGTDRTATG